MVTQALSVLSVDKFFLSAAGIDAQQGITDQDMREVEVKQAMMRSAREVILVCDSSKWGTVKLARIAVALAQQNSCEYCLSAHTAIGRKTGLSNDEIAHNRSGHSDDAKAAVAVKLARNLVSMTDLTIITNNVHILSDLSHSPQIETILLGGILKH